MRKHVTRAAATAGAFAAAGVAATVFKNLSAQRRLERRGDEIPFGSVHGESHYLAAHDDVPLHAEVDAGPEPTIVFLHGWMCDLDTWHYQRLALRGRARMVFYDLRSHGRSGVTSSSNSSLDDLADDLLTVLDSLAADSRVILVGHSMGGMAIMRFAARHREAFEQQVAGVVLIGTSGGKLMRKSPALRYIAAMMRATTPVLDWGREFNSFSVIKRWALGPHASETAADISNEMILRAPSRVIVNFYPNFLDLDLGEGFEALARIPTVVVGGTKDVLTPFSHSRWLARHIDGAELVTIEDAGHMMMFEDPATVTEAIERVLKEAA